LILRPELAAEKIQSLTMISGLAAIDAIEAETGLAACLKWPNDILLGGAKLGGILTETGLTGSRIDAAIVGIGLNVNLDPRQLPDDLLLQATSLSYALGRPVARLPLLLSLLRSMDRRYQELRRGADPKHEWAQRLDTIGKRIAVMTGSEELEGVAEGVGENGSLQVRLADGQLVSVVAGDVLQRPRRQI
jgi:BirA family biotin operon repressor/biotin-[acetyl-CoA-carboxylase] ligase